LRLREFTGWNGLTRVAPEVMLKETIADSLLAELLEFPIHSVQHDSIGPQNSLDSRNFLNRCNGFVNRGTNGPARLLTGS
jgi:hypothetical protein